MSRESGWELGHASERRKVLRKMLAEEGRMKPRDREKAREQQARVMNLSMPKITGCVESSGSYVAIKRIEGDTAFVTSRGKDLVFPLNDILVHPNNPGIGVKKEFIKSKKAEGRRLPGTATTDVLLQPDGKWKNPKFPMGRFWLYDYYHLTKQSVDKVFDRATTDVTQTAAYTQIKKILNRIVKKSQKECPSRFGVILDIITTNSLIQTGIPHELGNAAYRYLDQAHCDKPGLKFSFIGITDNINCRAARDVFCREHVRYDTNDSQIPEEPKRTFEALDNQHMYCVFPTPADPKLAVESSLNKGEFVMPKRTIPQVLSNETLNTMRSLCSKSRAVVASNPDMAKRYLEEARGISQNGNRFLKRPASAPVPAVTVQAGEIERPQTAAGGEITELAKMMLQNPAGAFTDGGALSTRAGGRDPVSLVKMLRAAKDYNLAHSRTVAKAHPQKITRIAQIESGQQLQTLLTKTTVNPRFILTVLFGAVWCKPYHAFLGKLCSIFPDYPTVTFARVDVTRLTEEAIACFVEMVPTLQIYHHGKLLYNSCDPVIQDIRECLDAIQEKIPDS